MNPSYKGKQRIGNAPGVAKIQKYNVYRKLIYMWIFIYLFI